MVTQHKMQVIIYPCIFFSSSKEKTLPNQHKRRSSLKFTASDKMYYVNCTG